MFLLDTVVISELRKSRPNPEVIRWLKGADAHPLFLSVVTIGEIERGIEKRRSEDAEFANELARWLNTLQKMYGGNILPVTADIASRWGKLSAQLNQDGVDLLIAATALAHGLIMVTRNTKHFKQTGVKLVNPFAENG